ncbi:MAG: glycosyltransferase [Ignavibacteriaceae bacterium]|nr:glycosyltransferase [Ignavibacteriaceae bacterium]
MFEIIFLVFLSGYFIQSVIFVIGTKKKFTKISEDELPTASVIVAARNEEINIEGCLKSLDNLQYPGGKLEIIIVDDGSTDKTPALIENFIKEKNNFKRITISNDEESKMAGKTKAVARGIENASGEIILTTDADCEVKPTWAKTIASYYKNDVGVVNGYTTQTAENIFQGMQAIDFIYLLLVAAGTINLGKPISCIGNNMSYRKKAYEEAGGYENLPFSVTEDFILLMGIAKLKEYKIIYPLEKDALVTSRSCDSIKKLVRQKKRWGVGGLGVPLTGFLIMFWGFFTNLCILLTPFFFSTVWLYLVFFKIVTDYFVLFPVHQKLGIAKNIKYFLAHQLYYLIYVVALPFLILPNRNVVWKGRKY